MNTILGVPVEKLDIPKYIRQLRSVIKWKQNGYRATIVAATAVGKSYIALITIKKILKKRPSTTILIIVPRDNLKTQWEKHCKNFKLPENQVKVMIINTAIKTNHIVDLLILDEEHLYASNEFYKIFSCVKYKWLQGLTATLTRLDGKHSLILKHAPICDIITQKEAREKGWISDFEEYNLAVNLTKTELDAISNLSKQIRFYMSKFNDFKHMQQCMNKTNATQYASQYGYDPDQVVKWAVNGQRYVHLRKEILYKSEKKIEVAVELIKRFGGKTITFSKSTEFADKLFLRVPNSVKYHSKIESELRSIEKTKIYKTKSALDKYLTLNPGKKFRITDDGYEVYWKENKLMSGKDLNKEALLKIKDNRYSITNIHTAQALNQGFDVADMELGISGSRDSNPTTYVQMSGRIARKFTYKDGTKKVGVFVNLYIPNTQDEVWLRAAQEKGENVIWVDSIDDII